MKPNMLVSFQNLHKCGKIKKFTHSPSHIAFVNNSSMCCVDLGTLSTLWEHSVDEVTFLSIVASSSTLCHSVFDWKGCQLKYMNYYELSTGKCNEGRINNDHGMVVRYEHSSPSSRNMHNINNNNKY